MGQGNHLERYATRTIEQVLASHGTPWSGLPVAFTTYYNIIVKILFTKNQRDQLSKLVYRGWLVLKAV